MEEEKEVVVDITEKEEKGYFSKKSILANLPMYICIGGFALYVLAFFFFLVGVRVLGNWLQFLGYTAVFSAVCYQAIRLSKNAKIVWDINTCFVLLSLVVSLALTVF